MTSPELSNNFTDALGVAHRWHARQSREVPQGETSSIPDSSHLLGVASVALDFYAADQPSPTDPGAYISVIRNVTDDPGCTTLLCKGANHGWSSHWIRTERAEIQAELYRNRAHQPHASVRLTLDDDTCPDNTR